MAVIARWFHLDQYNRCYEHQLRVYGYIGQYLLQVSGYLSYLWHGEFNIRICRVDDMSAYFRILVFRSVVDL